MSSVSEQIVNRRSRTDTAVELLAALAVVVLTILGLAHVTPTFIVAVATIVFGIGLILQGRTMAGDIAIVASGAGDADMVSRFGVSGCATVPLAGMAGIVLGILALLRIETVDLVAIAVIAFGGALILSANTMIRLRLTRLSSSETSESARTLAEYLASDAVGMQTAAGLAAVVLGILALSGFVPVTLILIALLALGALALAGSSLLGQSLMSRAG